VVWNEGSLLRFFPHTLDRFVEKHGWADLDRCAEEAEACAEAIECLLDRCLLAIGEAEPSVAPHEVNVVLPGVGDGIPDDFPASTNVVQLGESQNSIGVGQQTLDRRPVPLILQHRACRENSGRWGLGGKIRSGCHLRQDD